MASNKYDLLYITVVQDSEILGQIADAASDTVYRMMNIRKDMDFGAGTLIIVSSVPAVMPGIEYANAACVLENMVLAATDQKIDSTLWDGAVAAVKRLRSLKCRRSIPFL